MFLNNTEINGAYIGNTELSAIYLGDTQVWESFNGNLVLTDVSDWTTGIDSTNYWASIASFDTNPILLSVDSTADAVSGVGYAICNIPIDLSKYSSVTLKGKGMTRDGQSNGVNIVDINGNHIINLVEIYDEGYGVAIDKTVNLANYSQIGYVKLNVGVLKNRKGMYVQLDTLQFNK